MYSNERNVTNLRAVYLTSTSRDILKFWYASAQESLFGKDGRARKMSSVDVSDDDEEESIRFHWSKSESLNSDYLRSIAVFWLRTARAKLQRETSTWSLPSLRRRSNFHHFHEYLANHR